MRAFFQAIFKGDLDKVKEYLLKKPELINEAHKAPPKIDDGKSALQIAYCRGWFDIADYLIDQGADVNFYDTKSINVWKAPVIHDAIRAAIFSSRYIGNIGYKNTEAEFNRAFKSLNYLVSNGADVKSKDSYGNNCLMRACLDADQLPFNPKMEQDVSRVFKILVDNGADINEKTSTREAVSIFYKDKKVEKFFL